MVERYVSNNVHLYLALEPNGKCCFGLLLTSVTSFRHFDYGSHVVDEEKEEEEEEEELLAVQKGR